MIPSQIPPSDANPRPARPIDAGAPRGFRAAACLTVGLLIALMGAVRNDQSQHRPRDGEIPLGEWAGDGQFVFENWSAAQPEAGDVPPEAAEPDESVGDDAWDDAPAVEPSGQDAGQAGAAEDGPSGRAGRSIHRRYRTTLNIWTEALEDREFVLIEIRSRRGRLPMLEDESHLILALEEAKRVSPRTVLYRMVAFAFNPGPDYQLMLNDMAPPYSASCTTDDGVTVLQIHYMDNFSDTLRFEEDTVVKSGMYQPRDALVHWTERLERR